MPHINPYGIECAAIITNNLSIVIFKQLIKQSIQIYLIIKE